MVRIEEVLGDDCRFAVDCFANLDESYADRFVNNTVRTSHPCRRCTGRNHCLLDSGYRDIDHDHRSIVFGCLFGIGHDRGGNRGLSADDWMTVDARYPYYGRINARPIVSSCFEA